ncbi:uncharacterized protein V1518DRAFT_422652 [Limtongia smithiae]|uniref:uncharacterized protein n=1 Tax=Limtongia smithiae TaxID=1125753 RepID=UPI0034CE965C
MPIVYAGTVVHSLAPQALQILPSAAVGVDDAGTIIFVLPLDLAPDAGTTILHAAATAAATNFGWPSSSFTIVLGPVSSFFVPGFIDTHIHASQYPNVGLFGKTTLLDWLNTYTFPLEASFSNLATARSVYDAVIDRTLRNGTTTAAYYATIHTSATNMLADIALERGQRAFIGRCCMDANSPEYYRDESCETAQAATHEVIEYIRKIDPAHELVAPIITPRFALSCSRELLDWLGKLSNDEKLMVQTHVSENVLEVEAVKSTHPFAEHYTGVYDACGLLHERTILAHAVHLSNEERDLIAKRGAGISHCPTSNSALTSGEARVRWLLDAGIKVGLGTDVSGGFTVSILETARQALLVSRHLAMGGDEAHKLSIEEVLFLATLGGAQVCCLESKIGNFVVGKKWDAQLITLADESSPVDVFPWQVGKPEELVAKWIFNGDDRNVAKVWVNGRQVVGS